MRKNGRELPMLKSNKSKNKPTTKQQQKQQQNNDAIIKIQNDILKKTINVFSTAYANKIIQQKQQQKNNRRMMLLLKFKMLLKIKCN